MKKVLLVFILLSLINVCYSYEYKLPEDSEYYLNINTTRNIGGNTYDTVKKQINNQYKGKLKKDNTRPEFNLFEYGYYLNVGFSAGMTKNQSIKNNVDNTTTKTDFQKSIKGMVSAGIFWYNGFRWELEYSQDNKKEKDNFPIKLTKYDMNFIFENYTYKAKLTPYIGVGAGVLQGNIDGKYDYRPMAQGLIGFSYKIEDHTSFYMNYKYARLLNNLHIRSYSIDYNNQSIDFGFRIFLF